MKYKYFFLILLMHLSFNAYADIGVSPIIVDLIGKDADAEIAVKNYDNKNSAYVEITPYRLLNPANHAAPKLKIISPQKNGLLIFPAKLILLPGQTQFVRVIKTAQSLTTDQVYEVDFIPKVSTHLINQNHPQGLKLGIRVIIGYGARVTLRPDSVSPSISLKRIKNKLLIKNTGNTLLNITSCTQVIAGKAIQIPLPAYSLFVNQSIQKELAKPTQVTLDVSYMGKPLGSMHTE